MSDATRATSSHVALSLTCQPTGAAAVRPSPWVSVPLLLSVAADVAAAVQGARALMPNTVPSQDTHLLARIQNLTTHQSCQATAAYARLAEQTALAWTRA